MTIIGSHFNNAVSMLHGRTISDLQCIIFWGIGNLPWLVIKVKMINFISKYLFLYIPFREALYYHSALHYTRLYLLSLYQLSQIYIM